MHALIDSFEGNGRADLNVEFCAAIPLLTICGSFGVPVPEALDIRAAVTFRDGGTGRFEEILRPIIESRRKVLEDDLPQGGDVQGSSDQGSLVIRGLAPMRPCNSLHKHRDLGNSVVRSPGEKVACRGDGTSNRADDHTVSGAVDVRFVIPNEQTLAGRNGQDHLLDGLEWGLLKLDVNAAFVEEVDPSIVELAGSLLVHDQDAFAIELLQVDAVQFAQAVSGGHDDQAVLPGGEGQGIQSASVSLTMPILDSPLRTAFNM